ncbi:Probable manganese transport protein MntH [Listeria grayi]|uniref:Divalent metal cation transporter MntH n=3 Tax=Listeria grayi TaxID=1641 RepID=D7V191_LISGR|nr:Nramp family divalent metal transporter [Listeria grayi]EFI83323.1 manganese transport protein MntH [Listeria grayi DSM 20601]EUJ27730.1 manganese transport protein MntH [Listeria grayi FSL F6-1183]MBC1920982.1 Nramp family divalent metal transporter [Listeria grayi]VEI34879.1 Probable manganese transport protein MntH [Listeria grayi]
MKENRLFTKTENGLSLAEINNTVSIPHNAGFWKKLFAYSGPGALIAVGYMDPGNWVTSIAGGAQFGYLLLTVILVSSLIAMLLQAMSAKLGIVTGMDLAQVTRIRAGKKWGIALWLITELAIMATDIAEVIGSAVALNLLFNLPLLLGVFITVLDVFLLLLLTKFGFRKIEAIVATLIATILVIFLYEVIISSPAVSEIFGGFIPKPEIVTNKGALLIALGIVGATIMPHNLYLHSSIVQARKYDRTDRKSLKEAIKFATIDSNIQLTIAFIINCLLLILGASLFFGYDGPLDTLGQLYRALNDNSIVGAIASPALSVLFAVALLASGQNSTITGTLTGQIIMEGYIHMRMPMWARRMITRVVAIIPVIICIIIFGDTEAVVEKLLIYTQVFLSIALPFSIIPLTMFTSDKKLMGEFSNSKVTNWIAWGISVILTLLNIWLIFTTFS